MSNETLGLPEAVRAYLLQVGVREPDVLRRLRAETEAMPQHNMQIAAEQGAFMHLLVELMGARRCLEVGTFTGYSSTAVASALPPDGLLVCCDVSTEWTDMARRYWDEAGVTERIDLRIAPAVETLDALLAAGDAGTYDFAFIDADKTGYVEYYQRIIVLLRPGGLVALDNVLWSGRVADRSDDEESTRAIREINALIAADERVTVSMVPIGDGLTLARKR